MTVTKKVSTMNTTYFAKRKIEYIVIHYTAGTTSKKGSAVNTANWFMSGSASASSDYVVDDETIIQYNPDIENRYSWGVGGKKYTSLSTSLGGKYYGKCTNKNCINIEVCSNKTNKKSLDANDTDWYFTDSELKLTAELVKSLMKEYEVDLNHVIMHHHVTGKICPAMWTHNETELSGWKNFLKMIDGNADSVPYKVKVLDSALNIRKGAGISNPIVGVIKDKGVYTIIEEKVINNSVWGLLKGYSVNKNGWINVSENYCKKI